MNETLLTALFTHQYCNRFPYILDLQCSMQPTYSPSRAFTFFWSELVLKVLPQSAKSGWSMYMVDSGVGARTFVYSSLSLAIGSLYCCSKGEG